MDMLNTRVIDFEHIKNAVRDAFEGMTSKSGTPMVGHSLTVGDSLRNYDAITRAAGYMHDMYEDTGHSLDEIMDICHFAGFNEDDAREVAVLVYAVSYQPDEYLFPKWERKRRAVSRWSESHDIRIALIKIADVNANNSTADDVSMKFATDYREWALPFREFLITKWMLRKKCMPEGVDFAKLP